jgi:LysR family nitrogen assimilation transcriptional regulator
VSAILDLVADGAGYAILSRNAVMRSVRPSAFSVRSVCNPPLTIQLTTAISSLRPTTLTQQATLALITEVAGQWLTP